MKTAVQGTSIRAWRNMPVAMLKSQNDRIEAIVRASESDMSLSEIKVIYRQLFQRDVPEDKRIEANTVSRAVNCLIAAGRLERLDATRKCNFSGIEIHPVRVPISQHSLIEALTE